MDELNGYKCECAAGYEGPHCETNVDDCAENPCQNGGECYDEVDGYSCQCLEGYEGENNGTFCSKVFSKYPEIKPLYRIIFVMLINNFFMRRVPPNVLAFCLGRGLIATRKEYSGDMARG